MVAWSFIVTEDPSGAPLSAGFAGESVLRIVPDSMGELDQLSISETNSTNQQGLLSG